MLILVVANVRDHGLCNSGATKMRKNSRLGRIHWSWFHVFFYEVELDRFVFDMEWWSFNVFLTGLRAVEKHQTDRNIF